MYLIAGVLVNFNEYMLSIFYMCLAEALCGVQGPWLRTTDIKHACTIFHINKCSKINALGLSVA